MEKPQEVRGVGVLVVRNNKVLLGLRTGAHGADTWAPPGGKEKTPYQDPGQIAGEELFEETGMKAYAFKQIAIATNYFDELNQVHRSMFVQAIVRSDAEPELKEPDKCKEWKWFHWDELPTPLFPPFQSFVNKGILPHGINRYRTHPA